VSLKGIPSSGRSRSSNLSGGVSAAFADGGDEKISSTIPPVRHGYDSGGIGELFRFLDGDAERKASGL
jgi:hypothetical protein